MKYEKKNDRIEDYADQDKLINPEDPYERTVASIATYLLLAFTIGTLVGIIVYDSFAR